MQENNKLIAEFMGWNKYTNPIHDIKDTHNYYRMEYEGGNADIRDIKDMQYHTSWDWLMSVVEKIERMGCIVEIWLSLGKGCKIVKGSFKKPINTIANTENNSTILAVYEAVVEFITWHNAQ